MANGPTIYSVVMDKRTTDLFSMLDQDVRNRLEAFRMPFVAAYEEGVRKAYVRGVQDGFQQGVAEMEQLTRIGSPEDGS